MKEFAASARPAKRREFSLQMRPMPGNGSNSAASLSPLAQTSEYLLAKVKNSRLSSRSHQRNKENKEMKSTTENVVQVETVPLWIGGKPVTAESTRTGEVTNPATGKVIRHVPMANAADIDRAVEAGRTALPAWRDTPPLRRARVM